MNVRTTAGAALACAAALVAGQGCKAKADGAAAAAATAAPAAHHEELRKLSMEEVEAGIQRGDLLIFDNNSKKRYAEGHVPTAKWLDYKHIEASDLPTDKGKRMVFYCSNEH